MGSGGFWWVLVGSGRFWWVLVGSGGFEVIRYLIWAGKWSDPPCELPVNIYVFLRINVSLLVKKEVDFKRISDLPVNIYNFLRCSRKLYGFK